MLTYLAIARRYRPRWLVWENVPGVLSSDDGRAFGSLLGGLAELGYGFAYRVLDAQYFGLAQRRQRVFVVGCLGDWRRAAAVLFERESLSGHPAPRREAGEGL
jgi:DNA (cytosine-5)-methyltransferase 1